MGHRARYVPPFSMFLASVFAMFLAFSLAGGPDFVRNNAATKADRVQIAQDQMTSALRDISQSREELRQAQSALEAERAKPIADRDLVDVKMAETDVQVAASTLKGKIIRYRNAEKALAQARAAPEENQAPEAKPDDARAKAEAQEQTLNELKAEREAAVAEGNQISIKAIDAAIALVEAGGAETGTADTSVTINEEADLQKLIQDFVKNDIEINTPWPEINKKISHKLQNPELFLYKLQNTVYKYSFLLIPISVLFIFLLFFWKKNIKTYDHAVFSLYSLSFMSFLFLGTSLSSHWVDWPSYNGLVLLAVVLHLYFHFKGTYALGWVGAGWRTAVFVTLFAPVALALFFSSIIVLGAVG